MVIKVWLMGSDTATAGSMALGSEPVIDGLNDAVVGPVSDDSTIIAVGNHA